MKIIAVIILAVAVLPLLCMVFMMFLSFLQLFIDMLLLACSLAAIVLVGIYELGYYVVSGKHYDPGAGSNGKADAPDA